MMGSSNNKTRDSSSCSVFVFVIIWGAVSGSIQRENYNITQRFCGSIDGCVQWLPDFQMNLFASSYLIIE